MKSSGLLEEKCVEPTDQARTSDIGIQMYTAPLSLLHTHILSVYLHLPLNRSTSLSTLCSAFYFPFSFTTSSLYLCLPLSVSLAFSLSLSLHPFFLSVSFYLFILLFLFLPFVSLSSPIRSLSPSFLPLSNRVNEHFTNMESRKRMDGSVRV